jgi:hypothetical protein
MSQLAHGTVVAYGHDESQTFKIHDTARYGNIPRYSGVSCLGFVISRFPNQLNLSLTTAQVDCWNRHHPTEPIRLVAARPATPATTVDLREAAKIACTGLFGDRPIDIRQVREMKSRIDHLLTHLNAILAPEAP